MAKQTLFLMMRPVICTRIRRCIPDSAETAM